MARLFLAIFTTIAVVAFALSNSHHVQLSFGVGTPIQIRLVFLLACTFVVGMLVPIFFQMFKRIQRSRSAHKAEQERNSIQPGDLVGG